MLDLHYDRLVSDGISGSWLTEGGDFCGSGLTPAPAGQEKLPGQWRDASEWPFEERG